MKADVRPSKSRSKSHKNTKQPTLPKGIIAKKPQASETLIYGSELAEAITRLKHDLATPNSSPRALLFGAPGLGKSASAIQMSLEIKRPFWWVQVEEFAEQVETKGAFQFRQVFEAAEQAGAVLVFEDFDSFLKKRDEGEDAVAIRRIVASWLAAMDDFKQKVACIATTNLPSLFDQAIMRRFDRLLYFKRLTDPELNIMLKDLLGCETIPQQLLVNAKALSPAEITDLARQIRQENDVVAQMLQLIDERVRAMKIAGFMA